MKDCKLLSLALLTVMLQGCASTYKPPATAEKYLQADHSKGKDAAFSAAQNALLEQGFQITLSDRASGTISTAPRNFKVTSEMADCGTTMGLDYLKDNRTKTQLAFNVIASDQTIKVHANISAEYRVDGTLSDLTLQCVSRGTLERNLLDTVL